jgi:hypothetical protein
MMSFTMPREAMRAWVPTVERTSRLSHAAGTRFRERPSRDPHVICNAVPTLPEETVADVEQFKDDLENNAEGLVGGSRGDFMEALGEAVYLRAADDQLDDIISAYLTLQEVLDENVDKLDDEGDEAIDNATNEFNETVGKILGV